MLSLLNNRAQRKEQPRGLVPGIILALTCLCLSSAELARAQAEAPAVGSDSRPVSSRLKNMAEGRDARQTIPGDADMERAGSTAAPVEMSGSGTLRGTTTPGDSPVEALDRASRPRPPFENPRRMVPPPAPVVIPPVASPPAERSGRTSRDLPAGEDSAKPSGFFGFGRPKPPQPAQTAPATTTPPAGGAKVQSQPPAPRSAPAPASANPDSRPPARVQPGPGAETKATSPWWTFGQGQAPVQDAPQEKARPDRDVPAATASTTTNNASRAPAGEPEPKASSPWWAFGQGTSQPKPEPRETRPTTDRVAGTKVDDDSRPVSQNLFTRMKAGQEAQKTAEVASARPSGPPPASAPLPLSTHESSQRRAEFPVSMDPLPVAVRVGMLEAATELPSYSDSFYPTEMEAFYLGNYGGEYPRSAAVGSQGPDLRAQAHAGLAPYQNPGVFSYNPSPLGAVASDDPFARLFRPIGGVVRPMLGRDSFAYESGTANYGFSAVADLDVPFLTREFVPERAHFKAGPAYLDILSIGAGVLYSDFTGSQTFPEGTEPGWLSFLELQARALLKISPNVYLTFAGTLVYLPQENQLGLRFNDGFGFGPFVRLNFERAVGTWDIQLYDEFRFMTGVGLFAELEAEAFQQAGRYQFGYLNARRRSTEFLDDDWIYSTNVAGARASTPVSLFRDDWRLWLEADRTDFWRTLSFDDHFHRYHFGSMLAYNGARIPFAPNLRYDAYMLEDFDFVDHRVFLQGQGRLTENVLLTAGTGYLWSQGYVPDRDSWLWRVGLNHEVNERTSHRFEVAQDYLTNDFTADTGVFDYFQYSLTHYFASQLSARLDVGLSSTEPLGGTGDIDSEFYSLNMSYRPFDYTQVAVGALFQTFTNPSAGEDEFNRWLYHARVTQQVASRTNLWAGYQFEDTDDFLEHLYQMGIRRYF